MNFGKGFLAGVIVLLQTLLTRTLEFIYNSHLTKPCLVFYGPGEQYRA